MLVLWRLVARTSRGGVGSLLCRRWKLGKGGGWRVGRRRTGSRWHGCAEVIMRIFEILSWARDVQSHVWPDQPADPGLNSVVEERQVI